jgi:uncharacterized protein
MTKPLALVTGASSGIGYELAKQFAEHGYDLVIAAEEARITRAAEELRAMGASVDSVQVDLATYEGVERLYSTARAHGTPDAVAINAGIGVGGDFTEQTDLRKELRLIDLNVKSTVHLAKLAARDMAARGSGKILITSSVAATMPAPYEAVYAASKAFDASFAEGLRGELKDKGVTVTALLPGATDTPFFEKAGMTDTKLGQSKKDDPADVARDGYDALIAGKDQVVAGSLKNKLQAAAGRVLPNEATAAAHKKMAAPGSGQD